MCDYHSICVRRDGAIAHTSKNSHSAAAAAAGWQENTDQKTVFVECEWDGLSGGSFALRKVVSLRNGMKIEDLTNKQVKAITRHYKALELVMQKGDVAPIKPQGILHGPEYWDVYVQAYQSQNTSSDDREWIKKELLTATAGDHGTAAAGNLGTATAGDEGTATAGGGGTATAGAWGTATAGRKGTATAGYGGTAIAGAWGTATAGIGGYLLLRLPNGALVGASVDGKKIKANTPYRLDAKGKFVEVE